MNSSYIDKTIPCIFSYAPPSLMLRNFLTVKHNPAPHFPYVQDTAAKTTSQAFLGISPALDAHQLSKNVSMLLGNHPFHTSPLKAFNRQTPSHPTCDKQMLDRFFSFGLAQIYAYLCYSPCMFTFSPYSFSHYEHY